MNYQGWELKYYPGHPITGQWRAEQHGVTMCAGTKESIKRMIDRRIYEQRENRKASNESTFNS
jgi:hypothetical protein